MTPFRLESNNADQLLHLSGAVTIEDARALHAVLLTAVTGNTTLRIDAREVAQVDAAVMQVLLAAARAAFRAETVGASAAWVKALERLGIDDPSFSSPSVS